MKRAELVAAVRRSNLPREVKAELLRILTAAGRPRDSPEKRMQDEFEGALLRAEYAALKQHMKGREKQFGHRDPIKLMETRTGLDAETIRRRIKKARGLWPILDEAFEIAQRAWRVVDGEK